MKPILSITDPLARQEVTIIITLAASERPRAERPLLVSVGVAAQLPVVKTGTFSDLTALIHEAWTAFGVRAQVAAAAADGETIAGDRIVATASVTAAQIEDYGTTDSGMTLSSPSTPSTPQPQVKNLSLF